MMIIEWIVIAVFLLIVLCILAAAFGQNKGQVGETQIYKVLERLEGQKAIISNCYLPMKDSGTTEVDLVLIHESGIYVIESKTIVAGFLEARIRSIGHKVCQAVVGEPKTSVL